MLEGSFTCVYQLFLLCNYHLVRFHLSVKAPFSKPHTWLRHLLSICLPCFYSTSGFLIIEPDNHHRHTLSCILKKIRSSWDPERFSQSSRTTDWSSNQINTSTVARRQDSAEFYRSGTNSANWRLLACFVHHSFPALLPRLNKRIWKTHLCEFEYVEYNCSSCLKNRSIVSRYILSGENDFLGVSSSDIHWR